MKGGVRFDPEVGGFVAIVHTWDNVYAHSQPQERRASQGFATEEEALAYYKTSIRPTLERLMTDMFARPGSAARAGVHFALYP